MLGIPLPRIELGKARIGSDVDLTADDGLDICLFAGAIKIDHAVHHAVVCNGDRILPTLFDTLGQIGNATGTVKQAVFGMQVQVHKILHRVLLSRLFCCLIQQLLQAMGKAGFGNRRMMQIFQLVQCGIGIAVAQERGLAKWFRQGIEPAALH